MDDSCRIQEIIHVFSLVHKYVSRILGTYHKRGGFFTKELNGQSTIISFSFGPACQIFLLIKQFTDDPKRVIDFIGGLDILHSRQYLVFTPKKNMELLGIVHFAQVFYSLIHIDKCLLQISVREQKNTQIGYYRRVELKDKLCALIQL